mgnify:CR=1 FL=1
MSERYLKIEEVALTIGSSVQTINNWYRWRKTNPDNDFANLLPDYIQSGPKQTRYWNPDDIWKLIEFKQTIPQGRNGILGSVTQKGARKKREAKKGNI